MDSPTTAVAADQISVTVAEHLTAKTDVPGNVGDGVVGVSNTAAVPIQPVPRHQSSSTSQAPTVAERIDTPTCSEDEGSMLIVPSKRSTDGGSPSRRFLHRNSTGVSSGASPVSPPSNVSAFTSQAGPAQIDITKQKPTPGIPSVGRDIPVGDQHIKNGLFFDKNEKKDRRLLVKRVEAKVSAFFNQLTERDRVCGRLKLWAQNFHSGGRRGQLQFRCFCLTFFAYACTMMLRTPLGVIRHNVVTDLGIPVQHTGWMDTAMLLPLSVIQIISSSIKTKYSPRQMLGFALLGSAMSMLMFGMWHSYAMLLICLFLNGAAQAIVFPQCIAALAYWYTEKSRRTTVLGVWGLSASSGGIIGTAQATMVLHFLEWHQAFIIPSLTACISGLLVLRYLRLPTGSTAVDRENPQEQTSESESEVVASGFTYRASGMTLTQQEERQLESTGIQTLGSIPTHETLSLREIFRIPLLKEVAATYFCVNVIRYAVAMWLPIFLSANLKFTTDQAGWISMAFDAGALVGGPGVAVMTDAVLKGRKMWAIQLALLFSAGSLAMFYITSGLGAFFNIIFLVMAGFASGGMDMVLTGSLAVDLGGGKRNCISGVAGIINGCGVFGAMLQGGLVAFTYHLAGVPGTTFLMTTLAILPIVVVSRAAKFDRKIQLASLPYTRGGP
eukprot:m.18004 g.18004  ORF g.18004 m.18004 type:complete len:668 (-) comp6164_c0_seq1:85-2088(-)